MKISLQKFSYRFAEQVLNSNIKIKNELEDSILSLKEDPKSLSRPNFNSILRDILVSKGWESQPPVFDEAGEPAAKMDFLKERVGVEIEFGHASFIGIDLLKFQVASYSAIDKIDVGIYIVTTNNFQKQMMDKYEVNWKGSLSYEKVKKYLPYFKSAIQVPIYLIGIDV